MICPEVLWTESPLIASCI